MNWKILALLACSTLWISCTSTEETPDPIGKPTGVTLTQTAVNAFRIEWQRATNDTYEDTLRIAKSGVAAPWKFLISSPGNSATFTDETTPFTGGTYTVTISSRNNASDPATITLGPPPPISGIPTNLQVTSISSTSIGARWVRASDDTYTDTLIATPTSGGASIKVATNISEGTLTGLTQGVRYNIQAASTGGRTAALEWATAARSDILTIYETYGDEKTGHHSGLILGPIAKTASVFGAEKQQIDLVLATDNNLPIPYLSFQGADVAGSQITGGRATRMGDLVFFVSGGLDKDFYSEGFDDADFSLGVNYYPIPNAPTDPVIIIVKTADNPSHYARVEIIPQNGGFLWKDVAAGADSYRAIDVIVSYQTAAGVPYAGRPIGAVRGFNVPKKGEAKAIRK